MKWPPMPAGAGGLKGVTTNSEHLLFRIIIYLCLIYRLFRRFFFFFSAATASRPGLHPTYSKLGLLRWPVLIPCPTLILRCALRLLPLTHPLHGSFRRPLCRRFFRIYHGRGLLPQKSRNKTATFPHKGRLQASCFLYSALRLVRRAYGTL